jgi:hypothetical protein
MLSKWCFFLHQGEETEPSMFKNSKDTLLVLLEQIMEAFYPILEEKEELSLHG